MSLSGTIFLKDFHYLGKISLLCVKKWIGNTAWKVLILGVFLVEIRKIRTRKTPMWNLFTHWKSLGFDQFCAGIRIYSNTFQYSTTFAKTSKGAGKFARNGLLVTTCFVSFYTHCTKKWNFPLRNSSVYVNKRTRNCRFDYICWRNA